MNLDNVSTVIGNYTKSDFKRVCSMSSPTKNLCYQLLSEYIENGIIIPGTIVDRVLKLGFSPIDVLFHNVCHKHDHVFNDGIVDSLRMLLFSEHFIKPWGCEYMLVKLLTRAF